MKVIMNLALGAGLLGMAGAPAAECWDGWGRAHPPSGGGGKKVKVCDVEDPGKAAASLGNDIKAAEDNIVRTWHDLYGDIPQPIRYVLDTYPVTLAVAIFPETQAYALAVGAIETFVANSKQRAQ